MANESIFRTGGTLELGGRTLIISKTRKVDADDYMSWLKGELRKRSTSLQLAKENLEGLPPEDRQFLLRQALDEARREQDPDSDLAREIRNGAGSVARLLFLHARRKHPDLTPEWVEEQVSGMDIDALIEQLNEMVGDGKANPEPPAKNPPAPAANPGQASTKAGMSA